MTPGERMKNWSAAFMQLWPAWVFVLGMLGYTNKDEISGIIFTTDGQKITELTPFEKYAHEQFDRIDTERGFDKAELRAEINEVAKKLKSQDTVNYRELAKKLDAQQEELTKLKGLVQ